VGTLVINSNGTYTFTPAPNYNGAVPTATYTVSDGQGGTDTANLNITVTPVNDAPVANDDVNTTPEDTPVSGNVLTNDTDVDGNPLTVTQFTIAGVPGTFTAGQTATIPGVGTLVINSNGTYTFTPAPNYNGAVPTATYTVSDGQGGTDTANLNITVTPVNDAPVANDDVNTTPEDTPVSGNVLTNDTDVDGNPLTVTQFVINGQVYTAGSLANIPGVGTLVINSNGTYTFTPAPNYNGQMPTATYTVSDGQGGTDTANLNITVTPVNDAPVANDDVNTTPEDTPVSGNVLTNDTDVDGNPLTVTQFTIAGVPGTFTAGQTATIPGVGTLVINSNGTYTFTPAPNYNGTVPAVTYTVSDGQGGTDTALLQITVTPVNDAPVANDDVNTTPEDTPVSGNVLTNDTDVDGDALTVTQFTIAGVPGTFTAGQTATIPGVGTLVINSNGTYTFTPAPNYNGTVPPATYTISDGNGGTDTAVLQITVTPVGDPEDITITTAPVCERGPVVLQASTTTVANPVFRWYAEPLMTTLLFTGATYATPAITSTTTYYVSVSGTGVLPNQPGNGKTAVAVILPAPARPTIAANGPLTFCKDDSVTLDAGLATTYQWYKNGTALAGATQRTYTAKLEGDYTVIVTNASGCPSQPSAPALVRIPCVKGIYMPTVFTPNKDGVNDTVKPSVPGMKKFQCYKIYNRWGNLVFDNLGVLQGWDGTYKGVNQPADTYLWIVLGEDGAGKPMRATGQITLIR
jgi:gliding motility-associated-like protein